MQNVGIPSDPFKYKSLSKWHPQRVAFTIAARFQERSARDNFSNYTLPLISFEEPVTPPVFDSSDTSVTPVQMSQLLTALQQTESLGGPLVEIGSYRGITTTQLAAKTKRQVIAVDPYIGYGAGETDYAIFQKRVAAFANIEHWRMTSGQGMRKIRENGAKLSFVFVDAVHDYVNTLFDGRTYGELLAPQGSIAFHDTDDPAFPGTRRAVWEFSQMGGFEIICHVQGLCVFQKRGR